MWLPISPVIRRDPLGLVDRTTVDKADLVPKNVAHPQARKNSVALASDKVVHQVCAIQANPDHRWYWCSGVRKDEALFIRIFDSQDDGGVPGTPHTSFVVPGTEQEPKRQSIETRCFGE